jgi:hypothetical protein
MYATQTKESWRSTMQSRWRKNTKSLLREHLLVEVHTVLSAGAWRATYARVSRAGGALASEKGKDEWRKCLKCLKCLSHHVAKRHLTIFVFLIGLLKDSFYFRRYLRIVAEDI